MALMVLVTPLVTAGLLRYASLEAGSRFPSVFRRFSRAAVAYCHFCLDRSFFSTFSLSLPSVVDESVFFSATLCRPPLTVFQNQLS